MSNFKIQYQLLKKIKNYNKKLSKKIDPSVSPFTYMTPWAETLGYYKLQNLINNFKFSSIVYLFKDYYLVSKNMSGLKINKCIKSLKNHDHKIMIISYCQKSSFKQSIFHDQYFNFSSKQSGYLWLLISLDNYVPKKISNNTLIFFNEENNKKYRFPFFKFIIKFLFKKKFGFRNFFHWANSSFFFSNEIKKVLKQILISKNIEKIILNYEAIPFQHVLINEAKKIKKNIQIYCYLHCAGWPFQSDLVYRNSRIDKLFISGIDQKNNLKKYLGWPEKKLKNIASLRFSTRDNNKFGGQIFIPFKIYNNNIIISKFKNFLENSKDSSLNNFSLRIHPLNQKNKNHQNLKRDLLKLLNIFKNKFSSKKKKNISIVFGSITGISVQALESGVEILHFPNNFKIDVFNEKMWPNIKVEKYNNSIFKYSLRKSNKNFWVRYKKPKFENCFGNI